MPMVSTPVAAAASSDGADMMSTSAGASPGWSAALCTRVSPTVANSRRVPGRRELLPARAPRNAPSRTRQCPSEECARGCQYFRHHLSYAGRLPCATQARLRCRSRMAAHLVIVAESPPPEAATGVACCACDGRGLTTSRVGRVGAAPRWAFAGARSTPPAAPSAAGAVTRRCKSRRGTSERARRHMCRQSAPPTWASAR